MARRYSIYDAKTHFSEVVHLAEAGHELVVTQHGRPVAKIVPYSEDSPDERYRNLVSAGRIIVARKPHPKRMPEGVRKRGALAQFFADRE